MQSHPFQEFSASLIRKPGVADACLFVRDRYGLNVNLILFCVWVADGGSGSLSIEAATAVVRRIADWEQQVVEPLRDIHRACRHEPLGIPEFLLHTFEPHIETAGVEADRVEQLVLADFVQSMPVAGADDGRDERAKTAVRSLKAYLSVLEIEPDARMTECLSVVLQAVFSGAGFSDANSV